LSSVISKLSVHPGANRSNGCGGLARFLDVTGAADYDRATDSAAELARFLEAA